MKLEEAIYELQDGLRALRGYLNQDYNDAIELGIEALKLLNDHRNENYFRYDLPLPGETP